MAKRSTLQRSGQAMIYNFLINEVLASQIGDNYTLWVAAPWVTNFRLPNPFYVTFEELVSTKQEALYLFDIFYQISANGGEVKIVVGSDKNYHGPLKELRGRNERIEVKVLEDLHAKVYAGRYGALDGSLNLTSSGVNGNIEQYNYFFDERNIALTTQLCKDLFEEAGRL